MEPVANEMNEGELEAFLDNIIRYREEINIIERKKNSDERLLKKHHTYKIEHTVKGNNGRNMRKIMLAKFIGNPKDRPNTYGFEIITDSKAGSTAIPDELVKNFRTKRIFLPRGSFRIFKKPAFNRRAYALAAWGNGNYAGGTRRTSRRSTYRHRRFTRRR
jgi:hypothetical protein